MGCSLECVIGVGRHFYSLFSQFYEPGFSKPAPPTTHACAHMDSGSSETGLSNQIAGKPIKHTFSIMCKFFIIIIIGIMHHPNHKPGSSIGQETPTIQLGGRGQ